MIIEHQTADPDPVRWAEFTVIVSPLSRLPADARYDETANWDEGSSWDFRLPAFPLDHLPALIREVKPAHARLRRLLWDPNGVYWDGRATWDEDITLAPPAPPPALYTGVWGYPPATGLTDEGPVWDDDDMQLIYEYEGAPHA